jgi:hypothetical protein
MPVGLETLGQEALLTNITRIYKSLKLSLLEVDLTRNNAIASNA